MVLTEGWVGDYRQAIQRTSDVVESGQKINHLLRNIVQMVTTTQDNAMWGKQSLAKGLLGHGLFCLLKTFLKTFTNINLKA